jgi:hypothetical protein
MCGECSEYIFFFHSLSRVLAHECRGGTYRYIARIRYRYIKVDHLDVMIHNDRSIMNTYEEAKSTHPY